MINISPSNPIDLLKVVLEYQNWLDNETGTKSTTAKIKTGEGEGSFDSDSLDPVKAISIRFQIADIDKSNTDDLIKKICKQFSLIQYTDTDGYECVKYMFADVPAEATLFSIDQKTISYEPLGFPDVSKICINPVVKYSYDYATKEFTKSLTISNVQMDEYDYSYTSGFNASEGETYWNICKSRLWPLVHHTEDIDSDLSENELIADYDGAIFRLQNIIKLMSLYAFNLTTPFEYGIGLRAGSNIKLYFPHLSTSGSVEYGALVTNVSLSKRSNECNIEAVLLSDLNEEPIHTMLQDTDGAETIYQETDGASTLFQNQD